MAIEIITTVLSPATSYNLVDLATAKDELSIDPVDYSKDGFLTRAISQVSKSISSYCHRVFPVETIQDVAYPERDAYPYQVPGGVFALQLRRWPILPAVVSLTTNADTPSGAVLPFASTAGLSAGMPAAWAGAPPGIFIQSVADDAVTLNQPVAADVPAGTVVTFGLNVTVVDTAGTATVLTAGVGFTIDAEKGWLIRLNKWTGYPSNWDPVMTTVVYQGGYATIPDDLVDATLRVVTQRFQDRGRDPYLKSREQPGIGTETFWIGTRPGVNGTFTEEVAAILDLYRVPVTA